MQQLTMLRTYTLLSILTFFSFCTFTSLSAQTDTRIYDIIDAVSPDRIQADVQTLASFGTRHTLSDTVSQTRGIGAARRWIKRSFEKRQRFLTKNENAF